MGRGTHHDHDDGCTDPIDGIVEGTASGDLIDASYTGDPEGDMIDAGDAVNYGTAGSDDDYVLAGDGNDTVLAGNGDDTVDGGAGDDLIKGDSGASTGPTTIVLDFNDLSKGEVVGDQYSAEGVTISSSSWKDVMVFDTDHPTGGDTDLATDNLDKVLIISEDNDSSDPDDNAGGGTFIFDFDDPAEVQSLTFLDVEESGTIKFYDENGHLICTQSIETMANGAQNVQHLDVSGVARMEVTLNGSGAIDNLTYTVEAVEAPGDDLLFGGKGDDTILGEDGDDTLKGESGNDDLFGGAGDDSIRGGSGSDEIDGGSGADTINGGDDADTIIGGTAGDIVDGGSGGCDEDTLDLSGIGLFELVDVVPDSNGNGYNGVVNFLDDDLNVTASFEFYEIENIIGTPVSRSPEANPDIAEVDEDGSVDIDVLSNDTDPDNDISELTVTGANAGNGSVTVNADGTLTYEPAADFNGTDTIEYAITDPDGNTAIGTVTVTVNPVNDDPVAQDDVSSTDYQTAVNIDVLSNDSDIDGDTLEVIDAHTDDGSVMINDDGTLLFIPDDGFFGDAVIEYTVADNAGGFDTAQVIVTVSEAPLDGIVEGTEGADVIDLDYTGDPEGDMVDAGDAILGNVGSDDDIIEAFGGDDIIFSENGNDTINAGTGNDYVDGGAGNDSIIAGSGEDTVFGQGGNDTILGGEQDDLIDGGEGNDVITGLAGNDTIYGGDGDDAILAGVDTASDYAGDQAAFPLGDPNPDDSRDVVDGGAGNDTIYTGDDADTITGGTGDDSINAGIDDDLVYGDDGNDSIIGSHGSDTIEGGAGDDTIWGGFGPEPIAGFLPEEDDATDPVPENGLDVIDGGAGNDLIYGEDDDDTLLGGSGNDTIDGGIDDDVIEGGTGDDLLLGGEGDDTILGGAGYDDIQGGEGADLLDGGADGDTFSGVNAGDTVLGGSAGDDFDTLDLTGALNGGSYTLEDVTTDSDGNGIDGTVVFFDAGGTETGRLDFDNIEQIVPCFTPGSLIATPKGERLVEELREGDRIITRDNGIQEIRWVGRKDLSFQDLERAPHMRPILVKAGALGPNLPERDMLVSPNHRLLVASERTALLFDEREVLVAAKHLVDNEKVLSVDTLGTSYIHFLFDHHEVVLSDGAWTESFQPGDYSLGGLGNAQRGELFELFPELETREGLDDYHSARRTLRRYEASLLLVD